MNFERRLDAIEKSRVEEHEQQPARTSFEPDCICFPVAPQFSDKNERDEAASIKCPLDGDRFSACRVLGPVIFRADWIRKRMPPVEWVPVFARVMAG